MVSYLQYNKGVNVAMEFDPTSSVDTKKLNMWDEHTNELRLGMVFETKKHVQRVVKRVN